MLCEGEVRCIRFGRYMLSCARCGVFNYKASGPRSMHLSVGYVVCTGKICIRGRNCIKETVLFFLNIF